MQAVPVRDREEVRPSRHFRVVTVQGGVLLATSPTRKVAKRFVAALALPLEIIPPGRKTRRKKP